MIAATLSMVLAAVSPQGVQVEAADSGSVAMVWVKGHQREACHLARAGGCFFELPPGPAVLVLEGRDVPIHVAHGVSRFSFQRGPAYLFGAGLLTLGAGLTAALVSFLAFASPVLFAVGFLAVIVSMPLLVVGLLLPRGEFHLIEAPSQGGVVAI